MNQIRKAQTGIPSRLSTPMTIAIKRISDDYLSVTGATCGLTVGGIRCGGELKIQDFGIRDEFRYELFCEKCKTCDPNGYQTLVEVRQAVGEYFHGGQK
jgi:hypothetical protein